MFAVEEKVTVAGPVDPVVPVVPPLDAAPAFVALGTQRSEKDGMSDPMR